MEMLKNFLFEEDGQTLVEYALILVLIAIGAITAMAYLSGRINNTFSSAAANLAP